MFRAFPPLASARSHFSPPVRAPPAEGEPALVFGGGTGAVSLSALSSLRALSADRAPRACGRDQDGW